MAQQQREPLKSKLVACDLGMIRIYESNIPPIDGRTVYALPGGGYHWRGKNYRSLMALRAAYAEGDYDE